MKTKSCAEKLYALFLRCFPRDYRAAFGAAMLCSFRDMLEEQNPWSVWWTVLKESPKILLYEYLSALKGDLAMKNTWLSHAVFSGLLLAAFWLAVNLLSIFVAVNTPLWNLAAWDFPITLLVITPLLCAAAGFFTVRDGKALLISMYAGLLTAGIGCLIFVGSHMLLSSLPLHHHNSLLILNIPVTSGGSGSLLFLLFSLFFGALLGTIGGLLKTQRPARMQIQ